MSERYWLRPKRPECVRWTEPPEWVARLMERLGLTEVDAECYRVHRRVYRDDGT